jgi:hypothetical protein
MSNMAPVAARMAINGPSPSHRARKPWYVPVRVAVATAALLGFLSYPYVRDELSAQFGWLLRVEPSKVRMVVPDGATSTTSSVVLRNISSRAIRVEGASTNCRCAAVRSELPLEVPAGASQPLELIAHKSLDDVSNKQVTLALLLDVPSPPTLIRITVQRE